MLLNHNSITSQPLCFYCIARGFSLDNFPSAHNFSSLFHAARQWNIMIIFSHCNLGENTSLHVPQSCESRCFSLNSISPNAFLSWFIEQHFCIETDNWGTYTARLYRFRSRDALNSEHSRCEMKKQINLMPWDQAKVWNLPSFLPLCRLTQKTRKNYIVSRLSSWTEKKKKRERATMLLIVETIFISFSFPHNHFLSFVNIIPLFFVCYVSCY